MIRNMKTHPTLLRMGLVLLVLAAFFPEGRAQQKDSLVALPWGGDVAVDRTSVSSPVVSGDRLERTPYRDAVAGLTGLIPGLQVTMGGNWSYSLSAKGMSSTTCIIDDIPISFSLVCLEPNQIESVSYLSQTFEKAKYGPIASYGGLYIRTKKGGYNTPFTISAFTESGVGFADWRSEYVGAVDYARLNNRAREASGYIPLYSEEAIAAFAKGDPFDRRYPAVDWKSLMLRNWRPVTKAGFEAHGGTENIKYQMALNGLADGDYYKVGPDAYLDRINLTTSITARIGRYLTAGASFMGMISYRNEGVGGLYGYAGVIPVAFPVALGLSSGASGLDTDKVGMPVYAVSRTFTNNPYAYMVEGGYTLTRNRSGIFSSHLDLDLDDFVKGLSLQAIVNFCTQYSLAGGKREDYLAYIWDTEQDLVDVSSHTGTKASSKSQFSSGTYQNLSAVLKADWKRSFGDHSMEASLLGNLSNTSQTSSAYPQRYVALGASFSYAWKNRYIADLTASYAGNSLYARAGRYRPFPAAGLAWIASNEPFLSGWKWLDFLKVYVQAGRLAEYQPLATNFLYEGSYTLGSTISYGPATTGQWFGIDTQNVYPTEISRLANRNLTWPIMNQIEGGFDMTLRCGVGFNVNVFRIERSDLIVNSMGRFPTMLGYGAALRYENFTANVTQGYEATVSYRKTFGDWRIRSALNFFGSDTWSTKVLTDDYIYIRQRETGRSTGAYYGYVYVGKFETQEQIETLPKYSQNDTQIGDLRYKDLNGDDKIDANDQQIIGQTLPKLRYNLYVDLGWRNWELNLAGLGQSSRDVYLSGDYFRGGFGDVNYSVFLRDNLGGDYPRLSYVSVPGNVLNSNYWRRKCWFLRLRSVELAYNVPFHKFGVRSMRLSLKGADLLTLTNLRELDPESTEAGFSAYPFAKYVTVGVKLVF